ncbi:PREDICTED: embryonic polarity protein dorsal-like [Priapulus caudatus]|uniref:Embryonic polarity protein dorsal-like n=1 Tax=Priapulus caudatus TaxID=37621 RepID=A0ABM1DSZ8_PRICU|nr:PREDICTED: embryonic polarity protein dorsal-like [Priapulus caudatus]XP_014663069.1 PREDICTED: embryonic polarity protein dorsal-like [Priapulus caudatus]
MEQWPPYSVHQDVMTQRPGDHQWRPPLDDNANSNSPGESQEPVVIITEHPASKLRFRYECEGRAAGSIPGEHSIPEKKTFPAIQVRNVSRPFKVIVSCVSHEKPPAKPRSHPHSLVGKNCQDGVCVVSVTNPRDGRIEFPGVGIQCAKIKDRKDQLAKRQKMKIDPYKVGFTHSDQSLDVSVVRLCFQLFIPTVMDPETNQWSYAQETWKAIRPVCSQPIYDKRAVAQLNISRIDRISGPACGGQEVWLLCDKVTRDGIEVRFFEEKNGQTVWQEKAQIVLVHKQVAIVVKTPPYRDPDITSITMVKVALHRPTDMEISPAIGYKYYPSNNGEDRELAGQFPAMAPPVMMLDHLLLKQDKQHSQVHEPFRSAMIKQEIVKPVTNCPATLPGSAMAISAATAAMPPPLHPFAVSYAIEHPLVFMQDMHPAAAAAAAAACDDSNADTHMTSLASQFNSSLSFSSLSSLSELICTGDITMAPPISNSSEVEWLLKNITDMQQ